MILPIGYRYTVYRCKCIHLVLRYSRKVTLINSKSQTYHPILGANHHLQSIPMCVGMEDGTDMECSMVSMEDDIWQMES